MECQKSQFGTIFCNVKYRKCLITDSSVCDVGWENAFWVWWCFWQITNPIFWRISLHFWGFFSFEKMVQHSLIVWGHFLSILLLWHSWCHLWSLTKTYVIVALHNVITDLIHKTWITTWHQQLPLAAGHTRKISVKNANLLAGHGGYRVEVPPQQRKNASANKHV